MLARKLPNLDFQTRALSRAPETTYKPFGLLRFCLALLVANAHAISLIGLDETDNQVVNSSGTLAVMIFFILSGYIITEALNVFYKERLGSFLLNRFLRLFPPYCGAIVMAIGIHYLLYLWGLLPPEIIGAQRFSGGSEGAQIVATSRPANEIFSLNNIIGSILVMPMIYGIGMTGLLPFYPFVPPYWALNVEIQYYLIAGLFWYIIYGFIPRVCARIGRSNCELLGGDLPRILAVSCVVALLVVLLFLYVGAVTFHIEGLRYFRYIPYFLLGISIWYLNTRSLFAYAGLALGLLGVFSELAHPRQALSYPVFLLFSEVLLGCICVAGLSQVAINKKWMHIDRMLGDLSYPLYVSHETGIIVCSYLFSARNPAVWFLSLAMSVGLALFLVLATEPVFRSIRDRVRGSSI